MLLLMASLDMEDSCWEQRLRTGEGRDREGEIWRERWVGKRERRGEDEWEGERGGGDILQW